MASAPRTSTTRWVVVFALATAVSLVFNVQVPGSSPIKPASPISSPAGPASTAPASPLSTAGASQPSGSSSAQGSRGRDLLPTTRPSDDDAAWWDPTERPETAQQVFGTLMPAKASCAPVQFSTSAQLLSSTRSFVSCLHRALAGVLTHAHYDVAIPKIVVCTEVTTKHDCDSGDAAATMSTDNTMRVYWEPFTAMTSREATVVILHEYVHALQFWFGLDEDPRLREPDKKRFSRRMELQALCGSVILTGVVTSRPFGDLETQFSVDSGGDDHWNARSARYWIAKGQAAKNFGACDTWQAADRLVGG